MHDEDPILSNVLGGVDGVTPPKIPVPDLFQVVRVGEVKLVLKLALGLLCDQLQVDFLDQFDPVLSHQLVELLGRDIRAIADPLQVSRLVS